MAATETGRLLGSVPSIEEIEAGTGGALLLVLLSGDPTAFDGLLARLLAMDDALRADARPVDETATTAPTTDIARAGGLGHPARRPPTPSGSTSPSSTTS